MNDEFDPFQNVLKNVDINPTNTVANANNPFLIFQEEIQPNYKPIVLIIDDDLNVREALKIILEKKYNLILCSNGWDGIERVNKHVYAVVLDLKMEGKNGFETFREIKSKNAYLPIILYSAYQDLKNPFEIMNEYRPFGYVIKGDDSKQLLTALESAIDYYLQINKNTLLVQKLQIQEEQYRTLVNNLNVGVYRNTGGSKGTFLHVNPALAKIMGYDSVEEFISKSVTEFYLNPDERQTFISLIQKQGYCKNFELKLKKKDGSSILASISANAKLDSLGNVEWMDGILQDITEQKQAEEQMNTLMSEIQELNVNLEQKVMDRTAQVNEMLDQLGKLYLDSDNKRKEIEILAESRKKLSIIGQMVAGIVHDIKNPMTTIKYLAEVSNSDKITKETRMKNLTLIVNEMDRLNDLAYEILDFSRGDLNLDLQEINLRDFLSEIEQFLIMDFKYSGVKCILALQYDGNIRIDKNRMRRVIINLAKNAIEAMYDGKKEYSLTIRSEKRFSPNGESEIVLLIIDNGTGLAEAVENKIFDAFATEGKTQGTGLGLFMSKWIIESHKGKIKYETKRGEGTTFFIILPLVY